MHKRGQHVVLATWVFRGAINPQPINIVIGVWSQIRPALAEANKLKDDRWHYTRVWIQTMRGSRLIEEINVVGPGARKEVRRGTA